MSISKKKKFFLKSAFVILGFVNLLFLSFFFDFVSTFVMIYFFGGVSVSLILYLKGKEKVAYTFASVVSIIVYIAPVMIYLIWFSDKDLYSNLYKVVSVYGEIVFKKLLSF